MSEFSSYTKARTFLRILAQSDNSKGLPPQPLIGGELQNVLRAWLAEYAEAALRGKFKPLMLLKWAISGRAKEVLDLFDASDNPRDYLVAKVIRRIAARDRTSWGYITCYALQYHGWLGKELGNQSWVLKEEWYKHNGNEEVQFILRYSKLRLAVMHDDKIYFSAHGELHREIMERHGIAFVNSCTQFGFMMPDGKYLDREAAFRWACNNDSNLA
jgi:hypothetical protein